MDKLRNPKKATDASDRLQKSATMHRRNKSGADEAPGAHSDDPLSKEETSPAEKTTAQLVVEAQETHKDTTRSAQRALNTIEQTKQVKNAMLASLHEQNKNLENVDNELETMNEQISYSQRILLYMGRCCGCLTWMCDCCSGADPEAQRQREWERKARQENKRQVQFDAAAVDKQAAAYNGTSPSSPKKLTPSSTFNHSRNIGGDEDGISQKPRLRTIQSDRFLASPSPGNDDSDEASASNQINFRDIDVTMPKGYEAAGMGLAEESRKQNEMIDQIGQGLQELLSGSKVINEELGRQDKYIDRLDDKTDGTKSRLQDMNTKTMLKKYRN